jgi:hypothetical protein
MFKKILFILSLMLVTTDAWSQASINADMGNGGKDDDKFKFAPLLSVDHNSPFRKDLDPTTDFSLNLTGRVNKKHTIQILQVATKFYRINPNENEVEFSDTFLFHHWRLYNSKKWGGLTLRNSYTLPISTSANRNDTRGRWEQRLMFSKAFFGGKLFLAYRPFYRYFFNNYKQGENGRLINEMSYGHNILGVYTINSKFSLVSLIGQTMNVLQRSQFETQPEQTNETYFVTGFVNYNAMKNLGIRMGYLQANSAIINGRNEVYFFDEENSTWNLGVDYSF